MIRQRHDLLAKTIGVKKQEEDSLANCNTLMITVTVCMIVFSILEVALYLLYNRKAGNIMWITYHHLINQIISVPSLGKDHHW